MPSLIDIRRRIRAVKSTQQITKAMKMVASSKLRRAQERVVSVRPISDEVRRLIASVASRTDATLHPLLRLPDPAAPSRTLLIVVSADRGLCGSFNTNVMKATASFVVQHRETTPVLALVGRKGRDYFRHRGLEVSYELVNVFAKLSFEDAQDVARHAIEIFTSGAVSQVNIVYNEFKSILNQRVVVEPLLPVPHSEIPDPSSQVDYLYEPSPEAVLAVLLPQLVEFQVFRALLESAAAEHAARMTAMDTATRNSGEMIDSLTLYMNKVRQAAITREIIEVVSGAQAN